MSKVLVAYFSASGVTKKVAEKLTEAIGRKATGFVQSVWSGTCQIVAYKGLLEKFRQNHELKEQLYATRDAYLVECARL